MGKQEAHACEVVKSKSFMQGSLQPVESYLLVQSCELVYRHRPLGELFVYRQTRCSTTTKTGETKTPSLTI